MCGPSLTASKPSLIGLLAQPARVETGGDGAALPATDGALSPLEQEALTNLFDFGG